MMYDDKHRRQFQLFDEAQQWVADNPQAYARFMELAMQKVSMDEKFSIGAITEVVRWDASVRFNRKDFAIPNALRRYIAILMMEAHPEIEGFCTTKRGEVDDVPEQFRSKLLRTVVDDPEVAELFTNDVPAAAQPSSHGLTTAPDEYDLILAGIRLSSPSPSPKLIAEQDFEELFSNFK